jgi:transposase
MKIQEEIIVKNIYHLGLVAGLIDELEIVEHINQLVGEQPGEIVSPGLAVKAMIINGLGLVSAPLYLFSKFFEGKDTEHLIGKGIQPEHLNDYRLGRVLDKLYLVAVSQIFTIIALAAAQKFEVKVETSHLDSSSFHLHGNYDLERPSVAFGVQNSPEDESNSSGRNYPIPPVPISITYGYSRDHSPDLPQFIVQLIFTGDGDVPLFFKVASGNESHWAVFASIIMEFKNQLNLDSLMVAKSALYTAPNLSILTGCRWLSRVPQRLKKAQQLVYQLSETDFVDSAITGYRSSEHKSNYGGVLQRWVVESSARLESGRRKLARNIKKSEIEAQKQIRKLSIVEFACEADAVAAANHLSQQLKHYNLSEIKTLKSASKADVSSPNHTEPCPLSSIFKGEHLNYAMSINTYKVSMQELCKM